jgi:hypothetical protein
VTDRRSRRPRRSERRSSRRSPAPASSCRCPPGRRA